MKICTNDALPVTLVSTEYSIFDALNLPRENLWIFGYGSLMWDPGFPFSESSRAKIYGFHRALCVRSIRYRGTESLPGLVFGLDRGGSCTGVGFRVETRHQRKVATYLQDREMLNNIYDPSIRPIVLADGRNEQALTFIVRKQHPAYVKKLTVEQIAEIVASASGQRGRNIDYVTSTLHLLQSFGIHDRTLDSISQLAHAQINGELNCNHD